MNKFQLELAQNLIDQIDSRTQQKKVLKLIINDGLIIPISKNEYFVKSSENRFKVYHVFFSLKKGWLCNCHWYVINQKQTKSCATLLGAEFTKYYIIVEKDRNSLWCFRCSP